MDASASSTRSGGGRVVVALAALVLVGHAVVNLTTAFGFHRDELLYLAMGDHLRLWRMDFPPFIAIAARTVRSLFGDSLVAIRLVPALAATALVLLAAATARELGGRRFAPILAALAVVASPLFLRAGNLFQPVVLDQLWWTVALYALVRLCRDETPAGWLLLGVAGGLGLFTKFSILFLGAAILGAIVITPLRHALRTPWPYVALALALLIGSPSIAGQVALGWPVLGQLHDLRSTQLERVSTGAYLGGQLLYGPAVAVALAGVAWLLRSEEARPFRALGWACTLAFVLLLILHGKPYYIGPIYPALFAAGGVALERQLGTVGGALRAGAVPLVIAYGLLMLPLGVPLLKPPAMAHYASTLGLQSALRTNEGEILELPQDYADMLGWEEMVMGTARVYAGLSTADRSQAVVLASNYGEAGAIDLFGPRLGLSRAVSPAGTYWFFGPGSLRGTVAVAVGFEAKELQPFFGVVEPADTVRNRLGVPEERTVIIWICRNPARSLQEVWPSLTGIN